MSTNYIQAYPDKPGVPQGEILLYHVSTQSPQFRVEFYRQGSALVKIGSDGPFAGMYFPPNTPDQDWGWPGYAFTIPLNWTSGVYIGMLFQVDENGNDLYGPDTTNTFDTQAKFLFVVKSITPGKNACILYKLPLFTYYAYTAALASDATLYQGGTPKVTMRKPGGGTGGVPWDSGLWNPGYDYHDEYDQSSPRQSFAHWDAKFIAWLEGNGFAVDYCTDLDIHQDNGTYLAHYPLLVSVGHDEYWSDSMRNNVEGFIGNGGNVAFFSGNTCWWRVVIGDGDTSISCDKTLPAGQTIYNAQWCKTRPENSLTGVSYRNGGGRWVLGVRPPVGYTVQYQNHWIYLGTGLGDGQIFGDQESLIGYECDGVDYTEGPLMGLRSTLLATGADGTPRNFLILGYGRLVGQWDDFFDTNYAPPSGAMISVMGIYQRHGTVFTASTTDWARVLSSGNAAVVQITKNVIDRLSASTVLIRGTSEFRPCEKVYFVAEQKAKFYVSIPSVPINMGPIDYKWSIDNTPVATNGPMIDVTLPASVTPVTISVAITTGSKCKSFGSLVITPISPVELQQLYLICKLREILMQEIFRKSIVGIGEGGGNVFVDPLVDPPKLEETGILSVGQLERISKQALQIAHIAERLIAEHLKNGPARG